MKMKASFEKFCEETDLQGLSYINKSQSRSSKFLWIFLVLIFFLALVSLIGYNFWLYWNRPMGINQTIEKKTMTLPRMELCFRWAVYSSSAIEGLNVSTKLAKVLQWRIEATYLVDVYSKLSMYKSYNRSYADIEDLLDETRDEYLALMKFLNCTKFEDLVWKLRLQRPRYPWMKFKDEKGRVINYKTKSLRVEPTRYETDHPFVFSYYEVEMGFATFICELIDEAEDRFAAEIPITYPEKSELLKKEGAGSSMTRIFLSLSRLVLVKDELSNVIARIRPGTNCFVTYSIRTFEAINSKDRPCIIHDDGCQLKCHKDAVENTFPGCRHCQSVFTNVRLGNWSGKGPPLTNLSLCSPWEFAQCNFAHNRTEKVQYRREAFKNCTQQCKPLCNQTKYNYRVLPDKLEDHTPGNGNSNNMHLSRIIIEPEKGPLKYIHIRQYEIMTIASILSDFGGYLGLFLGSSLLTVVHICVFCCREFFGCAFRKCCPSCHRKTPSGAEQSFSVPTPPRQKTHCLPDFVLLKRPVQSLTPTGIEVTRFLGVAATSLGTASGNRSASDKERLPGHSQSSGESTESLRKRNGGRRVPRLHQLTSDEYSPPLTRSSAPYSPPIASGEDGNDTVRSGSTFSCPLADGSQANPGFGLAPTVAFDGSFVGETEGFLEMDAGRENGSVLKFYPDVEGHPL